MNVCILTNKRIDRAPRIIREIAALEKDAQLLLIGEQYSGTEPFRQITDFRSLGDKIFSRLDRFTALIKPQTILRVRFSGLKSFLKDRHVQVLIIHEPHFLPLAVKLKKELGIKLVYNAHEYHPLEFEQDAAWMSSHGKNYRLLYQQFLSETDLFVNVCESIRKKCLEEFGTDSLVVPNAAAYHELSATEPKASPVQLIHHGILHPSRKIEKMIAVAASLGAGYELTIMGVSAAGYEDYFRELTQLISVTPNTRLVPPVPFAEIVPGINQYDIGIYLLEPAGFNNFHALPNKFFEFIQARLAIVVSPSPEMKRLTEQYELGAVASDFTIQAMTEAVLSIGPEDLRRYKRNAQKAAAIENAEHYQAVFMQQILSLATVNE